MRRLILTTTCLCLALSLGACGGSGDDDGPPPAVGGPLATPRASIAHQLALLQAGKVDELRACFTARLEDRITPEIVTAAGAEAARMTMDDLFGSIEPGEYEGKKTAKVKMAGSSRTLTTLVLTDGKWLSDTIWFK